MTTQKCFPGTTIPRKRPATDDHAKRGNCRFCGTTELIWELHPNGWRLVDVGGRRHVCPAKRRA